MIKILPITASLENERLKLSTSFDDLKREVLDEKAFVILKNVFKREDLDATRKAFHQLGSSSPTENPGVEVGIKNFHRKDDDPERAAVKRKMHSYSVFFWNTDFAGERKFLMPSLELQTRFSGLPSDFASQSVEKGFLCSGRVSHYPRGGGHYAKHSDPVDLEKCSIIVIMSKRGVDFETGGLYLEPKPGQILDVEPFVEPGDLIVFDQSVPHGVAPVDPHLGPELHWDDDRGRWMMFSTITRFNSFHGDLTGAAKSLA